MGVAGKDVISTKPRSSAARGDRFWAWFGRIDRHEGAPTCAG